MRLIVVAVCDSSTGRAALRWAAQRAVTIGADVRIVTAVPGHISVGSISVGVLPVGSQSDDALRTGHDLIVRLVQEELPDRSLRPIMVFTASESPLCDLLAAESHGADLVVVGVPRRLGARIELARCRRRLGCPVVTVGVDHLH